MCTSAVQAEEEVAVQAAAFLGTATSSITQSIVVERLGAGIGHNHYLDMEKGERNPNQQG